MKKTNWCRGKGLCLKGGQILRPVNKNYKDSQGVLESFIRTQPKNCWSIPDTGCWLLPNGGSWLLP
jgi:hypothetical protein